jgi:uncharacterized protein
MDTPHKMIASRDAGNTDGCSMTAYCVLLAKYPQAGAVKTRLMPQYSAAEACRLYRSFLLDTAAELEACKAAERVVAFAPDSAQAAFRRLLGEADGLSYQAQPEGDLGIRMCHLLEWAFAEGAQRVVLIGADAPWMSAATIDQALALLMDHDVVLGPSTDGGYYLLGMRKSCRERPFTGIEWGAGTVFQQTIAALGSARLALLPVGYDVDTAADAAWLKVHLAALERAGEPRGRRSLETLRATQMPMMR